MSTARANRNTMLAPERRKLGVLVRDYVLANRGKLSQDYADHIGYTLPTSAGLLYVTFDRGYGTIFCRFEDVEVAKKRIGGLSSNLNPYSGKWNFHFGKTTASEAFGTWATALRVHGLVPILPLDAGVGLAVVACGHKDELAAKVGVKTSALTPQEAKALHAAALCYLDYLDVRDVDHKFAAKLESACVKLKRIERE